MIIDIVNKQGGISCIPYISSSGMANIIKVPHRVIIIYCEYILYLLYILYIHLK
jgi:hypothetical protein